MNKTIKRTITESYSGDSINSIPSMLECRTITEYSKDGIPTEEDTTIFNGESDTEHRLRRYDTKGRPSLDILSEDRTIEYSYKETPEGNTICLQKSINTGNLSFTDICISDVNGNEISSDTHYDEDTLCHTETRYDSDGKIVEIIRDGENWPNKTHHFYNYDRTADGIEICESKVFDGDGNPLFRYVSKTSRDANVETIITANFDEKGNIESEEKYTIEYVKDGKGEDHLLREDCWQDGKHIFETIYEYTDDDFVAVKITEKRFDLNCIEVVKTAVEFWN